MFRLVGLAGARKFEAGQANAPRQPEKGAKLYDHPSELQEYFTILCRTVLWLRTYKEGEMERSL